MLRRPGTRSVASERQSEPAQSQFVTELKEFAETGSISEPVAQPAPAASEYRIPDGYQLPWFLTDDDPEPNQGLVPSERWEHPFENGVAPSEYVLKRHGKPALQPPTDLPVGALSRRRGNRSVR